MKRASISFSQEQGHWECDLVQVEAMALSEDVVDFMAAQIQKLPQPAQELLKLAACVGNPFDLTTLAVASKHSMTQASEVLWPTLEEGLIVSQSNVYRLYDEWETADDTVESKENSQYKIDTAENITYRFSHDRVQQAAYSLIADEQKQATHYSIGQRLLNSLSIEERESRIFDLVNQLNHGAAMIDGQADRDQLAQLNWIACRKARSAIAYQAGQTYAQTGIKLLGDQAWQRHVRPSRSSSIT